MALESILNNKGIDNRSLARHTMASTRTMPFTKRQSMFDDNKVSVKIRVEWNGIKMFFSFRPCLDFWL